MIETDILNRPHDSEHFTLEEYQKSYAAYRCGITNSIPAKYISNWQKLLWQVLEPARKYVEEPIIITSGYRCRELNEIVRGASGSFHLLGRAADLQCKHMDKLHAVLLTLPHTELIYNKLKNYIHVAL